MTMLMRSSTIARRRSLLVLARRSRCRSRAQRADQRAQSSGRRRAAQPTRFAAADLAAPRIPLFVSRARATRRPCSADTRPPRLFMLVEAISLAMIRESARRCCTRRGASRTIRSSSRTSTPTGSRARRSSAPPRFNDAYVHTRAAHVEDWVALLVANHLSPAPTPSSPRTLWDVPRAARRARAARDGAVRRRVVQMVMAATSRAPSASSTRASAD